MNQPSPELMAYVLGKWVGFAAVLGAFWLTTWFIRKKLPTEKTSARSLSLDWRAVLTALALVALVETGLLPSVPW